MQQPEPLPETSQPDPRAALPRLIAWAALASLVLGVAVLVGGAQVAGQARFASSLGPGSIAPDSPYVRELYERSVPDDAEELLKIYSVLRRAGLDEDGSSLLGFYERCRLDRLRVDDAACRSYTVRAAIAASPAFTLGRREPSTLPASALRESFDDPLSFSFAESLSVPLPPANPDSFAVWYTRASGAVWEHGQGGGYLFLAAANRSSHAIEDFEAKLELPGSAADEALRLDCDKGMATFLAQQQLAPSATTYAICRIGNAIAIERVLAAVSEAQAGGGPTVRVTSFVLADPFVRIEDRAVRGPADLAVTAGSVLAKGRAFDAVERELRALGCEQIGTCQSRAGSAALSTSEVLGQHPRLLVALSGFLLALVVGGFAQRVLRRGFQIGALVVVGGAVAASALVSQLSGTNDGWGSMAAVAVVYYGVLAAVLWLPAYLLGIVAMRLLRGQRPPSP